MLKVNYPIVYKEAVNKHNKKQLSALKDILIQNPRFKTSYKNPLITNLLYKNILNLPIISNLLKVHPSITAILYDGTSLKYLNHGHTYTYGQASDELKTVDVFNYFIVRDIIRKLSHGKEVNKNYAYYSGTYKHWHVMIIDKLQILGNKNRSFIMTKKFHVITQPTNNNKNSITTSNSLMPIKANVVKNMYQTMLQKYPKLVHDTYHQTNVAQFHKDVNKINNAFSHIDSRFGDFDLALYLFENMFNLASLSALRRLHTTITNIMIENSKLFYKSSYNTNCFNYG